MGPCACVSADHVTSMTGAIKIKIVMVFFSDFLVCYPQTNPFKVNCIHSESKRLNLIFETQSWAH